METIIKGKAGQIGEIRVWAGKKYQKTAKGWRPVSSKKGPSPEAKVSGSSKIDIPLDPPVSASKTFEGKDRFGNVNKLCIDKMSYGYEIYIRKGDMAGYAENVVTFSKDKLKEVTEAYRDRSNKEFDVRYAGGPSKMKLDKDTMNFEITREGSKDYRRSIPGSLFKDYLSYLKESAGGNKDTKAPEPKKEAPVKAGGSVTVKNWGGKKYVKTEKGWRPLTAKRAKEMEIDMNGKHS